jgi:hypothetical protein
MWRPWTFLLQRTPLRVKRETLEVIPPIARVPNERESDLEAAYVIRLQLQWSCSRSSFTRGYSRLKKGFAGQHSSIIEALCVPRI